MWGLRSVDVVIKYLFAAIKVDLQRDWRLSNVSFLFTYILKGTRNVLTGN